MSSDPTAGRRLPADPYELDRDDLAALLADEPAYRVRQVWRWLVAGVDDPAHMTDLPRPLRERLATQLLPPPAVVRHSTADAGLTHKVLLRYHDGEAVESVLMLYPDASGRRHPRATVCVSTQAGCAMACPFCATGQAGLRRQLRLGEVVRQVTTMQRLLAAPDEGGPPRADHVTNVVFMGMGEPLANLDVTVEAVRWLHDPEGFGMSARGITVSTVGLVPGIRRLTELGLPITLAVSLHAPDDRLRDDLVPVNRQFPLATLLDACRDYREATGRRLTFEYVLIDGVNDRLEHAAELAALLVDLDRGDRSGRGGQSGRGGGSHVNLIPMNPTPAVPWRAPPVAHQRAFRDVLTRRGIAATIRHNRGGDIDAACGQLYAEYAVASGRMLPAATAAWGRWEALPVPGGRR